MMDDGIHVPLDLTDEQREAAYRGLVAGMVASDDYWTYCYRHGAVRDGCSVCPWPGFPDLSQYLPTKAAAS